MKQQAPWERGREDANAMKRVVSSVRMNEAVERLLLGEAVAGHEGEALMQGRCVTRGGGP